MAEFPKPSPDQYHKTFSFEDFQFDSASGDLYKRGTRIRLTPQCQSVLTVLLSKAGSVVTRQELRDMLWPDVFVDYERNLNRTVATLRFRLRDDPDRPRFIETLPTKGYRFIAPVTLDIALPSSVAPTIAPHSDDSPQVDSCRTEIGKKRIPLVWGLALSCALVIVAVLVYFFPSTAHRDAIAHTPGQRLVIADFENGTGDPVFDDTLKTGLNASLRQSPFLNVVSDKKVADDLSLMSRPVGTKLTAQVSAEVCQREGGKAYIGGAIRKVGTTYVLSLRSVDCHTGDLLSLEQTAVSSREKVLDALGGLATTVRTRLGDPNVNRFDAPLPQITTSSLDALKAYSAAFAALHQHGDSAAIPLLERAIQLDPSFAMAYIALGDRHENLGSSELAKTYIAQGFALRNHTSERERYLLSAEYYASVTDQLQKAVEVAEDCQRVYPDDFDAHAQLGTIYMWLGQFEKALVHIKAALAQEPRDTTQLSNLLGTYLALNRFEEAESTAARLKQLMPNASNYYAYRLAVMKNDAGELKNQLDLAAASNDLLVQSAANDNAASGGRILRLQFQPSDISEEQAARSQLYTALWEAEFHLKEAAIRDARAAMRVAPTNPVRTLAALVLARAGETAEAESINAELSKELAPDALIRMYWGSSISAAIELGRNNPQAALSALHPASSVDLSVDTLIPGGCMYPTYLRGLAFVSLRRGSDAITEFSKVVEHRGLVGTCPIGALARLQLGRAYELSGNRTKAQSTYEQFLASWAGADASSPLRREATLESAKLAGSAAGN